MEEERTHSNEESPAVEPREDEHMTIQDLINVHVKTLDAREFDIEIGSDADIQELRSKIAEVSGIEANMQRIIYLGKVLEDGTTLSGGGVSDGVTVHLVEGDSRNSPRPMQMPRPRPNVFNVSQSIRTTVPPGSGRPGVLGPNPRNPLRFGFATTADPIQNPALPEGTIQIESRVFGTGDRNQLANFEPRGVDDWPEEDRWIAQVGPLLQDISSILQRTQPIVSRAANMMLHQINPVTGSPEGRMNAVAQQDIAALTNMLSSLSVLLIRAVPLLSSLRLIETEGEHDSNASASYEATTNMNSLQGQQPHPVGSGSSRQEGSRVADRRTVPAQQPTAPSGTPSAAYERRSTGGTAEEREEMQDIRQEPAAGGNERNSGGASGTSGAAGTAGIDILRGILGNLNVPESMLTQMAPMLEGIGRTFASTEDGSFNMNDMISQMMPIVMRIIPVLMAAGNNQNPMQLVQQIIEQFRNSSASGQGPPPQQEERNSSQRTSEREDQGQGQHQTEEYVQNLLTNVLGGLQSSISEATRPNQAPQQERTTSLKDAILGSTPPPADTRKKRKKETERNEEETFADVPIGEIMQKIPRSPQPGLSTSSSFSPGSWISPNSERSPRAASPGLSTATTTTEQIEDGVAPVTATTATVDPVDASAGIKQNFERLEKILGCVFTGDLMETFALINGKASAFEKVRDSLVSHTNANILMRSESDTTWPTDEEKTLILQYSDAVNEEVLYLLENRLLAWPQANQVDCGAVMVGASELVNRHFFSVVTLMLQEFHEGESFQDAIMDRLKGLSEDIVRLVSDAAIGNERLARDLLEEIIKAFVELKFPVVASMASKKIVELMLQHSRVFRRDPDDRMEIPVEILPAETPARVQPPPNRIQWRHVNKLGATFRNTLEIDKKRQEKAKPSKEEKLSIIYRKGAISE